MSKTKDEFLKEGWVENKTKGVTPVVSGGLVDIIERSMYMNCGLSVHKVRWFISNSSNDVYLWRRHKTMSPEQPPSLPKPPLYPPLTPDALKDDAQGDIVFWRTHRPTTSEQPAKPIHIRDAGSPPLKANPLNIDPGLHYRFSYVHKITPEDIKKGVVVFKLDPFRICNIYKIGDLGQGTIVKKGLRLGTSIKDRRQDLLDIRSAVDRMLEIMDEDEN